MEEDLGCVWRAYAYGKPAFVPRLSRVRAGLLELAEKGRQR
jgi:hypothetical protein